MIWRREWGCGEDRGEFKSKSHQNSREGGRKWKILR